MYASGNTIRKNVSTRWSLSYMLRPSQERNSRSIRPTRCASFWRRPVEDWAPIDTSAVPPCLSDSSTTITTASRWRCSGGSRSFEIERAIKKSAIASF